MKTIGFVDYYLGEWHADNYPAWIRQANAALGEDFTLAYAWAELDRSPVNGVTTEEWCAQNGVQRCRTLSELCEKAEYILVLAPSDPEKHLGYAREVLRYRKNTYIDKTFAPDYATAAEIFAIAQENGTPFFSTSALRYAAELQAIHAPSRVETQGGGGNLPEYIIHQAEMVIRTVDCEPTGVQVHMENGETVCAVTFAGGQTAQMRYAPALDFAVRAVNGDGTVVETPITSAYFPALLTDILRFYVTGQPSFDPQQTLWVMKLREGALRAAQQPGVWLTL